VPLGDIRGDSTLVHQPVSKKQRAEALLVDSPEALAEIVRQNDRDNGRRRSMSDAPGYRQQFSLRLHEAGRAFR